MRHTKATKEGTGSAPQPVQTSSKSISLLNMACLSFWEFSDFSSTSQTGEGKASESSKDRCFFDMTTGAVSSSSALPMIEGGRE